MHLAYPIICSGCDGALDDNESIICRHCLSDLPETKYAQTPLNSIERLFWGKLPVAMACSYVFFSQGGSIQSMLHKLKYKGKQDVGIRLGELFGRTLARSRFQQVDLIIPVPLHRDKLQVRGFNQCDLIAQGMASQMRIPVDYENLIRVRANESQTRKGRFDRWKNVESLFEVKDKSQLEGKHILIVDDVVTTGSTLEACASVLLRVKDVTISIATIASPSPV